MGIASVQSCAAIHDSPTIFLLFVLSYELKAKYHMRYVGTKHNYHLPTSTCIASTLSYTVLEDDIKNEKQSSKQVEAET